MPSINEAKNSPTINADFDNSTVDVEYNILGTESETTAMGLLTGIAAASWTVDTKVLAHRVFDLKHASYNHYTGSVRYTKRTVEAGESQYQFETGGGTTHITHSIATSQAVKLGGGTAPNHYNAIGWDGKQINGCDIISPVYNFSESHVLPGSSVDAAYKLALFRATGKVNNGTFKGFAAGEAIFLGASGSSRRGSDEWEISYRFAASENVTGLSVGGLTGINKKGWEYLWLYFADDVSEDVLVKKPTAAYVEQVYKTADFSTIGIGT